MRAGAVILTLNEEPRIQTCLEHLKPHLSHLLVLDDESTDRTVELAAEQADKVVVKHVGPWMAEKRNYAISLIPGWCEWILFCDADERFDSYWLRNIKKAIAPMVPEGKKVCVRFPRLNMPKPDLTYPDYQVRFFPNDPDYEWRNEGDPSRGNDVLYSKSADKRVDQLSGETTLDYCPILHLPRRPDIRRPWW